MATARPLVELNRQPFEANAAVEAARAARKRNLLVATATGTGKTSTIVSQTQPQVHYLTDPQPGHAFFYVATIQGMAVNILGQQAVFGIGINRRARFRPALSRFHDRPEGGNGNSINEWT